MNKDPKARKVRRVKAVEERSLLVRTRVATRPIKAEGVNEMPPEALFCRGNGHGWDPNSVRDFDVVSKRGFVIEFKRSDACAICGVERVRTFDVPSFTITHHSTTGYPEGYLSAKGRIYRAEVRREEMLRAGFKVRPVPERKPK